jgi:hypothetical protein
MQLGHLGFAMLAMASLLSAPMRSQQVGGTCGARLRKAMQDSAAFARVVRDVDTASTPTPIVVIDSAFATSEQARLLREPGNLERMARSVEILGRTTAERIMGGPLTANVICISLRTGSGLWEDE